LLGRAPQLREQFYAISIERRINDPAIKKMFSVARADLFAVPTKRKR
jgi:hypothetical protein